MSNPYDNSSDKTSVLGPTLVFKGELFAEESLMLKGRVEGSITHTASVRIGEEGSVKGNIQAKHITVEGKVDGDLHGTAAVTVKESARVKGNIFAPVVSLVEGARFKGGIDMEPVKEAKDAPRPKAKDADAKAPDEPEAPKAAAGGSK